jgi:hypothetical protein
MELSRLNGLKHEVIGNFDSISIDIGCKRFDLSIEDDTLRVYKISMRGKDSINICPLATNVITID